MATAVLEANNRELSIGRVFSRGFGAVGAHPIAILGLGLAFGALPQTITDILFAQTMRGATKPTVIALSLAAGACSMVASVLVQGTVVLTVVARSEGMRADIADTLPPALIRLLPLILLGLAIGIGFTFGLVLLIIPGLMLYMAWWVAAPALVVERLGVIDALNRSSTLTRDGRWKIFGIELVLGVASLLTDLLLLVCGINWATAVDNYAAAGSSRAFVLAVIVTIVVRTLTLATYGAMHASTYVELREWKEGPAVDALADVFS